MTLPGYEFLPAPIWILHLLHVVTLTLHFVGMSVLVGAVAFLILDRRRGDGLVHARLIHLLPSVMAATITAGVAPLLFAQLVYPRPIYGAAIASGWYWMGIVGVAMLAYYLLYTAAFSRGERGVAPLLWLTALALVYISLVYSSVFAMAERPDIYATLYAARSDGTGLNPSPITFVPRWLHMVLGAWAVGSLGVGVIGRNDARITARTRSLFTISMGAAMVTGVVYLMTLSDIMKPLMRGAGVWMLTVAVLLALASMHLNAKGRLLPAGLTLALSLLGMVALRHLVRLLTLGDAYAPSALEVRPQWGVFGLFLLCFVAAIAVCAWMGILFARGERDG